jgi:predicted ATPase
LAAKQQDKLVIDDYSNNVIEKMLEFIYDDKVDLGRNMTFVEEMLFASGKYRIEKLKVGII